MLSQLIPLVSANLISILRDRMLHAVMFVALAMLLLVPMLSTFSMQQVQELAITLSLSATSFVLLIMTLLLGTSSIFRDVERRFVASILTLPISRANYILAKFVSIAIFLTISAILLGFGTVAVIELTSSQYPSGLPIPWANIILAIVGDLSKYLLLSSVSLLFSAVSTSFFLPFFGSIAIYFSGSASQGVFEFVSGEFGQKMDSLSLGVVKSAYYVLPNFSAFDFKVHAIYSLPVSAASILYPLGYGAIYSSVLLGLAIWSFNRRQFA